MLPMSIIWLDKEANKCAWVENLGLDNQAYFKYYNHYAYHSADKVAVISLIAPSYLDNALNESKQAWRLCLEERQELVNLLNKSSRTYPGCTNWQAIIIRYNFDNLFIQPLETIECTLNKEEYPNALSLDFPMPNYLEL